MRFTKARAQRNCSEAKGEPRSEKERNANGRVRHRSQPRGHLQDAYQHSTSLGKMSNGTGVIIHLYLNKYKYIK